MNYFFNKYLFKLYKYLFLFFLMFSFSNIIANVYTCPSIKQVLINNSWKKPKNWHEISLSPLANLVLKKTLSQDILYKAIYIKEKKQLRCIYIKQGNNIKQDYYIIANNNVDFAKLKQYYRWINNNQDIYTYVFK